MSPSSLRITGALIADTFREAFSRKIFWGFFGCSSALILFFIFIMRIDVVQGAVATVSLFGSAGRTEDVQRLGRGRAGCTRRTAPSRPSSTRPGCFSRYSLRQG